ncbi:hypothetical protein BofuT4_uP046730.1 [Botrytis cinerea T4]|uniref:Uncharacterized protein n=1 Tax=Botryotinia fuckeliana (strain T4) TaxID=999810 RepID=G2XYW8_BOTF4|nr:hypothetical protein BofuT4_uP046730.1 [Botrytis cinerea T4]
MDDWALYEGISGIGVLGLGLAISPVCEYHVIIDNTLYVRQDFQRRHRIFCDQNILETIGQHISTKTLGTD